MRIVISCVEIENFQLKKTRIHELNNKIKFRIKFRIEARMIEIVDHAAIMKNVLISNKKMKKDLIEDDFDDETWRKLRESHETKTRTVEITSRIRVSK